MAIGDFRKDKGKSTLEYDEWKATPSDATFGKLMTTLDPVINNGLTSYGYGDKTLRTRARIIAGKAVNTWDPKHNASLNSWVYQNLQGLRRIKAERSQVVHIPENVRLDRMQVHRFRTDYEDKHGYDPDDDTIADNLEMSRKRVQKATQKGERSDSAFMSDKGDLPGIERSEQRIWMDYVYHDLDPMNRKIFEWTTGYNGKQVIPKREIAQKLRISAPAISLRVNKIMKKLQEFDG
jgi:DNA-directed RNA polymerase specialized sigma subunit